MNTAKVEQAGNQQQQVNNNDNNGGSSAVSSIWGFQTSQANGNPPASTNDSQSNKLNNLWSLGWSEGSGNDSSMPNASGSNSGGGTSGPNVWGMGNALEDLMTSSNGSDKSGAQASGNGNGNESRAPQQASAPSDSAGPAGKSNWSSASGNPGDSPIGVTGGGNSGVISPGGSSNGSGTGVSSDSKLISQWIGDSSDKPSNVSTVLTGTNAWGSSNINSSNSNSANSSSNWGTAGNIPSESNSAWQQQSNSSQQQQQQNPDQSWGSNNARPPPTSVRSYSQAATGGSTPQNQSQPQGQQQSSQGFHQQAPSNQPSVQQQQQPQQSSAPIGSASSPCSPPLGESFGDNKRDDEMRQMVDNCDGWGQRGVNQETTWDVEDVPEAKPRTDENPNVWPTFVNKGTNGWEESCRRRKVTPGSHHAPPVATGWGESSHTSKPPPPPSTSAPVDAWNKWGPTPQTPSQQPAMPWSGPSGHGNMENRMSGGAWTDDSSHRSVSSSRDESPMGPNNGWQDQGTNNWNRQISGIGSWQQPQQAQPVMSPSGASGGSDTRMPGWSDGIGQWSGNAKTKGSSSGDSVSGDFEVEQWNNPGHAKDNDYGEFEDMLPKRWSSASTGQMPSGGPPQRRIKSSEMMPPASVGDFGQMTPQRSALTETLMQLGVSKDDATKALINSDNDYAQAIRWLVQQGKLSPSCLNSAVGMGQGRPNASGSQMDMYGQGRGGQNAGPMPPGGSYPPGSPNQMLQNQQQPAALSLQDRIRLAQQRSQVKLNALPPSSNQVIVEQLRKAVHQGYLNQHVLNMQLTQDVLKLIHDLINHQIVLEQVQRDDQNLQQQIQMVKLPPAQAQNVDQQRQALQHEMCRIRLIMEQRKMQIAQRTGTAVAPTPGVPPSGGASPVGGAQAPGGSGGAGAHGRGAMPQQGAGGRSGPPTGEFGQMNIGGSGVDQQSKLMQWRMQTTPERNNDPRSAPASDNWMPVCSGAGSHFSPNNNEGRSQQTGISGGPAVVEFVPGKPWAGLSLQSTEDDPHMTPASAAKPPLAVGSDSYLDTLTKSVSGTTQQLVGSQPRMSSAPTPPASSNSPRPSGMQSWNSGPGGAGPQMQYGRPQQQNPAAGGWGGSPWGTGASVPMTTGSGMPSDMDPGRFLPWGLTTGGSTGNGNATASSGYDPSRLAGNFM